MLARELITDLVPALKTSDTGIQALSWMDIFRISHLPIVNNNEFLGLISDKDIYNLNMAEEPIGAHNLSLFSPFVHEDQHVYEVISLVSKLELTVVPVLDHNNHYLGLITMNDLLKYFSGLAALEQPGGVIVLELNHNDFSMSQISQIVEGNDARILSMYVSPHEDSTKMEVNIKLNTTDISSIVQTFNRYDYIIKASYMEGDDMNHLYESRFDEFMKYLSI